ncbi:MAG: hypothetical protein R3321_02005 [Nitrososphaeraceae archaeon]|nr:hypothetical protein [Nitrososphaeraceae archaeon]
MNKEITYHVYHLIPKHAGGTDHSDNLVKVNIAMHAFLHQLRAKEYNSLTDLAISKRLQGMIGKEKEIKKAQSKSSLEYWDNISEDEYNKQVNRAKEIGNKHKESGHWDKVHKIGTQMAANLNRYRGRKHISLDAFNYLKELLSEQNQKYHNNIKEKLMSKFPMISRKNYYGLRKSILNGETYEQSIGLDTYLKVYPNYIHNYKGEN